MAKKAAKLPVTTQIINSFGGDFRNGIIINNKEFIIQKEVMGLIDKLKFPTKEDNSFDKKTDAVKAHLLKHGSITSWEAIKKYRATRLSAIIYNLKKKGFVFRTVLEKNNKSYYARYYFLFNKIKK